MLARLAKRLQRERCVIGSKRRLKPTCSKGDIASSSQNHGGVLSVAGTGLEEVVREVMDGSVGHPVQGLDRVSDALVHSQAAGKGDRLLQRLANLIVNEFLLDVATGRVVTDEVTSFGLIERVQKRGRVESSQLLDEVVAEAAARDRGLGQQRAALRSHPL